MEERQRKRWLTPDDTVSEHVEQFQAGVLGREVTFFSATMLNVAQMIGYVGGAQLDASY